MAAIVPAEFAEALEGMSEQDARELLEDLADGAAARQALAEPGERARKAFLSLDKPVRRRIGEAVDALAADPRGGRLTGRKGCGWYSSSKEKKASTL